MLDPRIYRTALLPVVLAVIVLAFSLSDQQGPMGTNLAPDAYSGQNAYTTMQRFAKQYPNRQPGSIGDDALASEVAGAAAREPLPGDDGRVQGQDRGRDPDARERRRRRAPASATAAS